MNVDKERAEQLINKWRCLWEHDDDGNIIYEDGFPKTKNSDLSLNTAIILEPQEYWGLSSE